jgi:DnaK suppressor protein
MEELVRLRAAMRRSGQGMRTSELAHLDNHPGDMGSDLHDEEIDETTELFLAAEEARIADARRSLADGSYGVCRECRRPIPPQRLRAVPEATRCVDCQRHVEGAQRQRFHL